MGSGHGSIVRTFLEGFLQEVDAQRIILITDDEEAVALTPSTSIVVTPKDVVLQRAKGHRARLLVDSQMLRGLSGLDDIRTIILETIALGHLEIGPTLVLVRMSNLPEAALIVDPRDEPLVEAMRVAVDRGIEARVFQSVISLAIAVAREGREGYPAGAMFIVGDRESIMRHCTQGVINPFEGHAPNARDVRSSACSGTIKTYATVDGAVLVEPNGLVAAAGLYVMFDAHERDAEHRGGRHLAAHAITRLTQALAVVVSQEGSIRVMADGKLIADLDHVR